MTNEARQLRMRLAERGRERLQGWESRLIGAGDRGTAKRRVGREGEEEGALGWLTFPHVWTVCLVGVSAARSVRLFVHLVAWESAESSLVILPPSMPVYLALSFFPISLSVSCDCLYLVQLSVCLSDCLSLPICVLVPLARLPCLSKRNS